MAKAGRVVLRGRFRAGSVVRLVKVKDESVLRAEGGKVVAERVVGDDGVEFTEGVEAGGRYFVTGQIAGEPVEVRVRGNADDEVSEVLEQPRVTSDRVRRADGSWDDEHGTPAHVFEADDSGAPVYPDPLSRKNPEPPAPVSAEPDEEPAASSEPVKAEPLSSDKLEAAQAEQKKLQARAVPDASKERSASAARKTTSKE